MYNYQGIRPKIPYYRRNYGPNSLMVVYVDPLGKPHKALKTPASESSLPSVGSAASSSLGLGPEV